MEGERRFSAGTRMYFGVPANPMPETIADAIGQLVAQVPGIVEAYLPQCYIEGEDEARQVLVVGVQSKNRIPEIMQDLMGKMELVIPSDQSIDMLPFSAAGFPPEARVAECRIFGSPEQQEPDRPWWKFW